MLETTGIERGYLINRADYRGFRGSRSGQVDQVVKDLPQEDDLDNERGQYILCRNCSNMVTSRDKKTEVAGKHKHTFTNPGGYVFRIGCFASASGLVSQGNPSVEFTWFAGYSWRYTLCLKCFSHLGWVFESGENHFFGLILDRLVESKD